MTEHLTVKNVRIVDVREGNCSGPVDIVVDHGIVKKIGKAAETGTGLVFDGGGALVSPGWIESHTHFDMGEGADGFDIMRTYLPDGITCALDAGSRGPANYESLARKIAAMPIPLKTYLHVARNGCTRNGDECNRLENIDKALFTDTYQKYREMIIGVKIRIDPRVNCDTKKTLHMAQDIAAGLKLPLIIHPTRCEDRLDEILSVLKPGDVMAHSYSLRKPCILDEEGRVKDCVWKARERGVFFDLSHGSSNFSWKVGRRAVEQGFLVDVISTDLHGGNIAGPVYNLADTMTKCLHIGMTFPQVMRRVTVNAAEMLGIRNKSLAVEEGKAADFVVFKLEKGEFSLNDSMGETEVCRERFTPVLTVFHDMMCYPRHQVYTTPDYD